jgi:hypothetical protein
MYIFQFASCHWINERADVARDKGSVLNRVAVGRRRLFTAAGVMSAPADGASTFETGVSLESLKPCFFISGDPRG